jgi:hypothetical protein
MTYPFISPFIWVSLELPFDTWRHGSEELAVCRFIIWYDAAVASICSYPSDFMAALTTLLLLVEEKKFTALLFYTHSIRWRMQQPQRSVALRFGRFAQSIIVAYLLLPTERIFMCLGILYRTFKAIISQDVHVEPKRRMEKKNLPNS